MPLRYRDYRFKRLESEFNPTAWYWQIELAAEELEVELATMRNLIDQCAVVYFVDDAGTVNIPQCEIDRLRDIIRVLTSSMPSPCPADTGAGAQRRVIEGRCRLNPLGSQSPQAGHEAAREPDPKDC